MALQSDKTPPASPNSPIQNRVKKTYRKPQLNNFGTISELTAAGSKNAAENGKGIMP